jgi:chromosome segregation ATPase
VSDARDLEAELARLEVRLSETEAEVALARAARKKSEAEARRLTLELAGARTDLAAVRNRLAERETYVRNLHASSGWKVLQAVRGLFRRRW